jgi:hypothetical protein
MLASDALMDADSADLSSCSELQVASTPESSPPAALAASAAALVPESETAAAAPCTAVLRP